MLDLGFERPITCDRSKDRISYSSFFSKELTKNLRHFSLEWKIPAALILLGAYQVLLYRYCSKNEFVIGIRDSNKNQTAHLNCQGQDTFQKLLTSLQLCKTVNCTPIKPNFFFSTEKNATSLLDNASIDLHFSILQKNESYLVTADALTKAFYPDTIENMVNHYSRLLENLLKYPHEVLEHVPFLSPKEEDLLLNTLARTTTESYPDNILDTFTDFAKHLPNKIAVKGDMDSLTYSDLDIQSNQLASYLTKMKIGADDVVAVSTSHCPKLIIALLAIIKIGATYLPLDPSYPEIRLQEMLKDAKPKILLTQSKWVVKFNKYSVSILQIDTEWNQIQTSGKEFVYAKPDPFSTAYIIYTSGSTGKPKGIMIAYRSLSHLSLERKMFYPEETIPLLLGSIAFDISLLMIFHTLMTGGTLCIPEHSKYVDGEALIQFMEQHCVNYLMCVPSFYAMLLEKSIPLPAHLLMVSLVGEVIPNSLPILHQQLAPEAILNNEYGPCEIAIGSNHAIVYDSKSKKINRMTIGKPLPNTDVFILTPNLSPALLGTKGEICIGGIGLAKGYLNNKKLTEEKFVDVSFNRKTPNKLYRTGDFGRLHPDGNFEFLGRMDTQIKLRGHRIELDEIERKLMQHIDIDEAVILLDKNNETQGYLVAYFTTMSGNELSIDAVRDFLKQNLPKFMIPTHFLQLKNFPRTLIKKIDRKALPKILNSIPIKNTPETSSEIKSKLLSIWKDVLGNQEINQNKNFFDLGGNSLLLATVQTKVKGVFGVNIPMIEFFNFPTLDKLAVHLKKSLTLIKLNS